VFTSFIAVTKGQEKQYLEIADIAELKKVLEDKLAEYQENVATMNLVLFL
jgi:hypothetical protein